LAEQARQQWNGVHETEWLTRLEMQHDNLNAALQWCLDDNDAQASLSFGGNLIKFWLMRGHLSEGRAWLTAALGIKAASVPTRARSNALRGAGTFAYQQCDYAAARAYHSEARDIDQQRGDQLGVALALVGIGDTELAV